MGSVLYYSVFLLLAVMETEQVNDKHTYHTKVSSLSICRLDITCEQAKHCKMRNPGDLTKVKCIITRNGSTQFNKTVHWSELSQEGFSMHGGPDLDEETIDVSLVWLDREQFSTQTTIHVEWEHDDYAYEEECETNDILMSIEEGQQKSLDCVEVIALPDRLDWNKPHAVAWYRNCDEINTEGNLISLVNVSLQSTPGMYHCEVTQGRLTVRSKRIKICVKRQYGQALIYPTHKVFYATPGSDVTMYCNGNSGTANDSPNQGVVWSRALSDGNDTTLCIARKTFSDHSDCTYEGSRHGQICKPLSAEEERMLPPSDLFTSSMTLRNVSHNDAGSYNCLFHGMSSSNESFRLIIRHESHFTTVISISVIFGVSFIVGLHYILLFHVFRFRTEYLLKKCRTYEINKFRYVAYLVYAEDAFENTRENPVLDVMNWFKMKNYNWFDPNRCSEHDSSSLNVEDNLAGALLCNGMREKLQSCSCLVIIVTNDLIVQNTCELLQAYEGFKQNVKDNLRIVFICTPEMRKEIGVRVSEGKKRGVEYGTDRAFVTFQKFMRKQKSTSRIVWNNRDKECFKRQLFVALPKFRSSDSPLNQGPDLDASED